MRRSYARSSNARCGRIGLVGAMLLAVSALGCGSSDPVGSGSETPPPEPPPPGAGGGIPDPVPRAGQNVVQFVNESNATLLLAAFGPSAVLPREGTWKLPPGGYLTIDIPPDWQNTTAEGTAGPRFWARTGCRYDEARNIAQCETGDWGGNYDAFKGTLRPFPVGVSPNTFTEWCFNCGDNHNFWDVSAVDGADISVNIQPLKPYSDVNPKAPGDAFWCKSGNVIYGKDLREDANCPAAYRLKRSQLSSYIIGSEDHTVACFSNCGKLKYPLEPPQNCTDAMDPRCSAWKRYCCTAGPSEYSKTCNTDADCSFGDGCLELVNTSGQKVKLCQCRGWIADPPCPDSTCTNQDAGVPPFGTCSNAAGPFQCIGDDTVHKVFPRAFSWPNDPQTYDCDARAFRVTFSPGGNPVPISSAGDIPTCQSLGSAYAYQKARNVCSGVANKVFGGARPAGQSWDCSVNGPTKAVLCRW